jgi:hypothetical protein
LAGYLAIVSCHNVRNGERRELITSAGPLIQDAIGVPPQLE